MSLQLLKITPNPKKHNGSGRVTNNQWIGDKPLSIGSVVKVRRVEGIRLYVEGEQYIEKSI